MKNTRKKKLEQHYVNINLNNLNTHTKKNKA